MREKWNLFVLDRTCHGYDYYFKPETDPEENKKIYNFQFFGDLLYILSCAS